MKEYIPNHIIIDKAVDLWVQMLSKPKYDNIGNSEPMTMQYLQTMTLASMLPKNNTPEVLEKFREALRDNLLNPFTTRYMERGQEKSYSRLISYIAVDYDPDPVLRDAAEKSGLKMEFPWKTSMHLTEHCVSLSYGYGAEHLYHYPLSDGRWFVTTLYGSDIEKVIKLIEDAVISTEFEEVIC
jgi:hypothetical protein